VIEVESQKLVKKFKIEKAGRLFLACKEELFYQDKAQFKHVLNGSVLKSVNDELNTKQA